MESKGGRKKDLQYFPESLGGDIHLHMLSQILDLRSSHSDCPSELPGYLVFEITALKDFSPFLHT